MWEIESVWRDYTPDRDAFYEHFGPNVTRKMLDQALAHADRLEDEIESMTEQKRQMERLISGRRV